jgi:hypothetical protein
MELIENLFYLRIKHTKLWADREFLCPDLDSSYHNWFEKLPLLLIGVMNNTMVGGKKTVICLSSSPCGFFFRMKTLHPSETSVGFYRTTWRHIPEDYSLHSYRCENLKFNIVKISSLWPRFEPVTGMWSTMVKVKLSLVKVKKIKLSLQQVVEAHTFVRRRGSHIF